MLQPASTTVSGRRRQLPLFSDCPRQDRTSGPTLVGAQATRDAQLGIVLYNATARRTTAMSASRASITRCAGPGN